MIEYVAYLERLACFPLLARFLYLGPTHLLLKLSLTYTAIILKREKDIKVGELLELLVISVLI